MTEDSGRVPAAPGSREPSPDGLGPSGFDPSRKVWLIWATQGEYSDRSEWPIAVALTQRDGEERTERLGQLWRYLCQEYRRREDELDAAEDWNGRAIYETPEGREFLAIGGSDDYFGGYADDRMYTCCEVRVVMPRDSDGSGEAGETVGLDPKGDSASPQGIAQTTPGHPKDQEDGVR